MLNVLVFVALMIGVAMVAIGVWMDNNQRIIDENELKLEVVRLKKDNKTKDRIIDLFAERDDH